MYQPRNYRHHTKSDDLISFRAMVAETDLYISAEKSLQSEAERNIKEVRSKLEAYIAAHPFFEEALYPIDVDSRASAIVKEMASAAKKAGVGPMAAVAGAIAESVGRSLLEKSPQVIVENGGDIFISSKKPRTIGIYAGRSRFSKRLGIELAADETPCGACTSSGTVGHSLSFGLADAVVVVARSAALADAVATSVANKVRQKEDVEKAIDFGNRIKGVKGIVVIIGDTLGSWGEIKLVDIR